MANPVKSYLWKQKVHRGLTKHSERWRILIEGEQWLCPYCGETAFRCRDEKKLPESILDHFANECKAWEDGKGEMMSPALLKKRAEEQMVRTRLQRRPVWKLYDLEGHWYCPYCGQSTEVKKPLGDKIDDATVAKVDAHLKSCVLAKKSVLKEIPLEILTETVQRSNRVRGLVGTIRGQMEARNDLWVQHDQAKLWICPYCVRVVENVRLMDTQLTLSVAPPDMAEHLLEHCPEFKRNPQLSRDPEEFKSMVAEICSGKRSRGTVQELQEHLDSAREQIKTTSSELDRAREVQQSVLPSKMPKVPGFEIACTYQPAAQLGGDFYSFIKVDESHLGFLMADVSGHGADAALIMTMTKKAFDLRGPSNTSPMQVLGMVNRDIYGDLKGRHFVTAFYGVLDIETSTIFFSRGGHNYPLVYNPNRRPSITILKSKGSALGFGPNEIFEKNAEECELALEPGDLLLVYTDGLVEAKNEENEDFELPNVCDIVKRASEDGLEEMLQAIIQAVTDYVDGRPQEDDIALMAIRYTG